MRLLLLRLEGPLQSWGEYSKWDDRDSSLFPTKSGLIGLISCCMGLERGDSRIEEMHRKLSVSVRADNPGKLGVDFHTVRAPRLRTADGKYRAADKSTIVSHRQYLEGASFLATVSSNDERLLDEISAALKHPVWAPFLGRKSCVPTCPVFIGETSEYCSHEQALRSEPLSLIRDERANRFVAEIESPDGLISHMDNLLSAENRRFSARRVDRITIAKEEIQDVSLAAQA